MSSIKLSFVTAFSLVASTAFAQADLGISGSQDPATTHRTGKVENSAPHNSISPEAVITYEKGEAPFYVNLQTYSNLLFHYYRNNNERALMGEASALEINISDLESITLTLNRFVDRSADEWISQQKDLCLPILRGERVREALIK